MFRSRLARLHSEYDSVEFLNLVAQPLWAFYSDDLQLSHNKCHYELKVREVRERWDTTAMSIISLQVEDC